LARSSSSNWRWLSRNLASNGDAFLAGAGAGGAADAFLAGALAVVALGGALVAEALVAGALAAEALAAGALAGAVFFAAALVAGFTCLSLGAALAVDFLGAGLAIGGWSFVGCWGPWMLRAALGCGNAISAG
jgi:hypothetical protein